MDTEMGILWKAKIEKLYEELGQKEVVFFSPEAEAKFEQDFKDLKLSEREARKEVRRNMFTGMSKHEGAPFSYILAADKLKAGSFVSN